MSVVLITGANRGIGLGFARQYAERGDQVIATCRDPGVSDELQELAEERPNVSITRLDVASDSDIADLARLVKAGGLAIDILISNAGVLRSESFGDWTREQFMDTFGVNIAGAAMVAQALLPLMSDSGKLVHLSSRLGSTEIANSGGGMAGADSYSVSKAALNMLTVKLASVSPGSSKTVVAMSPGWVATAMGGAGAPLSVEESVSNMIRTIEALTPEDSGRFIDNEGSPLPW